MSRILFIGTILILSQGFTGPAFLSPKDGNIFHGAAFSLLGVDANDFDFRDENNRPIKASAKGGYASGGNEANKAMVEELFLFSAWNLLVLGQTIPKKFSDKTLAQVSEVLDRLRLLAKKFIVVICAVAVSSQQLRLSKQSIRSLKSFFRTSALTHFRTSALRLSLPSFIPLRL